MEHYIISNPSPKQLNESLKGWEAKNWKAQGGLVYGLVGNVSAYSILLVRTAKKAVKSTGKRFKPPTLQEVKDYIKEKSYGVNANLWMAHYKKNGWETSKGRKMKDWHGAVQYWQFNNKDSKQALNIPIPKEFQTEQIDESKKVGRERIKELQGMSQADIYKQVGQLPGIEND